MPTPWNLVRFTNESREVQGGLGVVLVTDNRNARTMQSRVKNSLVSPHGNLPSLCLTLVTQERVRQ
jgi:hypothetical protein